MKDQNIIKKANAQRDKARLNRTLMQEQILEDLACNITSVQDGHSPITCTLLRDIIACNTTDTNSSIMTAISQHLSALENAEWELERAQRHATQFIEAYGPGIIEPDDKK